MTASRKSLSRKFAFRPGFDALEDRQLMAAGIVSTLDARGMLYVEGTYDNDQINVIHHVDTAFGAQGDQVLVKISQLRVNADNTVSTVGVDRTDTYLTSQIKGIFVDGQLGKDQIHIDVPNVNSIVFGGDGDDVIDVLHGNNILFGGTPTVSRNDGNDLITGGDGNDTIFGGGGNDVINAKMGTNALFAGTGNDTFAIETVHGNNSLFGGPGGISNAPTSKYTGSMNPEFAVLDYVVTVDGLEQSLDPKATAADPNGSQSKPLEVQPMSPSIQQKFGQFDSLKNVLPGLATPGVHQMPTGTFNNGAYVPDAAMLSPMYVPPDMLPSSAPLLKVNGQVVDPLAALDPKLGVVSATQATTLVSSGAGGQIVGASGQNLNGARIVDANNNLLATIESNGIISKIRLISNNGGTARIPDGALLISNNGATIGFVRAGHLISNNGGTLISNNGGRLTSMGYIDGASVEVVNSSFKQVYPNPGTFSVGTDGVVALNSGGMVVGGQVVMASAMTIDGVSTRIVDPRFALTQNSNIPTQDQTAAPAPTVVTGSLPGEIKDSAGNVTSVLVMVKVGTEVHYQYQNVVSGQPIPRHVTTLPPTQTDASGKIHKLTKITSGTSVFYMYV